MATTFELISSVTVGAGGAASVSFTSIPSTFTDLVLKLSTRSTGSTNEIAATFNGSTSGFTGKQLYGSGSSAGSNTSTAGNMGLTEDSSYTANTFNSVDIYLPNYASGNYKSYGVDSVTENNGTQAYASLIANLWSNTAGLTSITATCQGGSFTQYSTAYLYGVKNA